MIYLKICPSEQKVAIWQENNSKYVRIYSYIKMADLAQNLQL